MSALRWFLVALTFIASQAYGAACSVPGTVTGTVARCSIVMNSQYGSGNHDSTVSVAAACEKACLAIGPQANGNTVSGTGSSMVTVARSESKSWWFPQAVAVQDQYQYPGQCHMSWKQVTHYHNGTTVDLVETIERGPQQNSWTQNPTFTTTCPTTNACTSKLGTSLSGEVSAQVSGKIVPFKICSGGCGYVPIGGAASGMGVWGVLAGKWTYTGNGDDWRGDGQTCTGSPIGDNGSAAPATPASAPFAPGKCPGEVNGVAVVVSCDSTAANSGTAGAGSSGTGLPTTANSPTGTPGGTGNVTKNTVCENAICVTTTNTTNYGTDGKAITTPTYTTDDQGTFCSKNPGSPLCTGYSDGKPIGEGTGEPEEEEPTPECEEGNTTLGCAEFGTPGAPSVLTSTNTALSITADSGWSHDMTCPATRTVVTHFVSIPIPFTMLCDVADMARPLVIAVAWLSGALLFVGMSRRS